MTRGKYNAQEDGIWRPSAEDHAMEGYDEELEEELNDELRKQEIHNSSSKTTRKSASRASSMSNKKTATHRSKRQMGDETWKPTDEDIEDEELEVQEMVNAQLCREGSDDIRSKRNASPKKVSSRKASPKKATKRLTTKKPRKEEDETWDPDGKEVEQHESEQEDEEPADERKAPKHKAQKRPAEPSPGSPELHKPKASKPGPRPKHRLTTATNHAAPDYIVRGQNAKAPFTFAAYRGEGMSMLAMNWKNGTPPDDFVGFLMEYREPQSKKWWPIPNYMSFPGDDDHAPVHQRFRWVHFPFPSSIDVPGKFHYRVTVVFMKGPEGDHTLTYGATQEVAIELMAETYPGKINVAFTRGFVSSKAFTKKYGQDGLKSILPAKADEGLDFKAKDPKLQEEALAWMGFEARQVILSALDQALKDTTATVRMLAYDFNEPGILSRLQRIGKRVKIIIDDSNSHETSDDAETKAAAILAKTAGKENVQRQHMGNLQHNKVLIVDGNNTKIAIGGSTNFSWRGLYVQNNNLVALQGAEAVRVFTTAFENYWDHPNDTDGFYKTVSSEWHNLGFKDINAKVTFSPHNSKEGTLQDIAADIDAAESSLFYSLAFLYETPGVIREAIERKTKRKDVMVYGLADKSVGGLDVRHGANPPIAYPADFEDESAGGSGARMHHKFVCIDHDKPTARVYTGSHNFSTAADTKNAENLFFFADPRVATAYMIEAVSMFDHYEARDHVKKKKAAEAKGVRHDIHLRLPPSKKGETSWWGQYWTVKQKIQDREKFGI